MELLKEVKNQAIDYLTDNQDIETYGCDLHNEIFNTDYFCVYTSDAKKYLENYGIYVGNMLMKILKGIPLMLGLSQ